MTLRLRSTEASEAWAALLAAFNGVRQALADEMDAEAELSLERYEILLLLSQATKDGMRPSELADRRRLSRSGATRLVDRLVRDGLLERRPCDGDGRGSLLALTSEGEDRFRRAGRIHLRGIEEHVGSHLSREEAGELRRLLTKVAERVHVAGRSVP